MTAGSGFCPISLRSLSLSVSTHMFGTRTRAMSQRTVTNRTTGFMISQAKHPYRSHTSTSLVCVMDAQPTPSATRCSLRTHKLHRTLSWPIIPPPHFQEAHTLRATSGNATCSTVHFPSRANFTLPQSYIHSSSSSLLHLHHATCFQQHIFIRLPPPVIDTATQPKRRCRYPPC